MVAKKEKLSMGRQEESPRRRQKQHKRNWGFLLFADELVSDMAAEGMDHPWALSSCVKTGSKTRKRRMLLGRAGCGKSPSAPIASVARRAGSDSSGYFITTYAAAAR